AHITDAAAHCDDIATDIRNRPLGANDRTGEMPVRVRGASAKQQYRQRDWGGQEVSQTTSIVLRSTLVNSASPALICAIVLLTACGSPATEAPAEKPAPKTAEQVRGALLEAMIQPDHCYMNNLEYAIRDPDFLDQVLKRLLGNETLEQVGADPREF